MYVHNIRISVTPNFVPRFVYTLQASLHPSATRLLYLRRHPIINHFFLSQVLSPISREEVGAVLKRKGIDA